MAIRRGSSTPSAIYRGATAVQKVMRGTVEVWSASIYPLVGDWAVSSGTGVITAVSHTITEAGNFTLTMSKFSGSSTGSISIAVNGTQVSTAALDTTNTRNLQVGNIVTFRWERTSGSATGAWWITKN